MGGLTARGHNFNHGFHQSSVSQDENQCFPCGMVLDKEMIAKIIRGIETEGYLLSWLVGWSVGWLPSSKTDSRFLK